MEKLDVIVVTYNNGNHLNRFIQSLKKISKDDCPIGFTFVDNNSSDSTRKILFQETKKMRARLLLNTSNLGFARAVNLAIRQSEADYILLLNPDSIIPKNAIKILYSHAKTSHTSAIVGGKLIDAATAREQDSHTNYPTLLTALFEFTSIKKLLPETWNVFSRTFWYKNSTSNLRCQEVWSVCGAFMLFPKKIFHKLGGFDEQFFLYLEDLDFCIRAKRSGYPVFFCPSASIYHISGGSSMKSNPKFRNNEKAWRNARRYFFTKHLGFFESKLFLFLCSIEEAILQIKWNRTRMTIV